LQAAPLSFSFTGTVGRFAGAATLSPADGAPAIDLAGAAFTVSGLTGEDPLCTLTGALCSTGWWATATYDFGALGSFTADQNTFGFIQGGNPGSIDFLELVLWYPGTIDFQGFKVTIPTVLGDPAAPTAFGTVAPTGTLGGTKWVATNSDGHRLSWGFSATAADGAVRIDSATVQSVPEPATLSMIGVGLVAGYVARRRRRVS
jgi:hypothetical protein